MGPICAFLVPVCLLHVFCLILFKAFGAKVVAQILRTIFINRIGSLLSFFQLVRDEGTNIHSYNKQK
ncbi:hypothetical protein L1987_74380 [Smallanthus sonchifolius]|uniref:Uncharacterized protein n=1 Tax=Smallanthus sonchifolius TaxID=185202 RepID=A0ACB9A2L0_9ASTR|nr:hypothetical protein L1987_74380 [Smallanthus sonchifolius]